jgi:hypothetical protein
MTMAILLALMLQAEPSAAAVVREHGDRALKAEDLEAAGVLYSIARWMEPSEELKALEEEAAKKLRAATALTRATIDTSALTDCPWDALMTTVPGKTKSARSGRSQLVINFDGERVTLRGSSVSRKRERPGELEVDRFYLASEDEVLLIDGTTLKVVERKPPGALAGKLMKSEELKTQVAGMMVWSVKSVVRALRRINDFRRASGLAPVAFSAELSYGVFLHARYLVNEDPAKTAGMSAHDEVEGPWKTAEGALAGRRSDISSFNLEMAVDQLMATLYHRVPLLEPGLASVGIGHWEKQLKFSGVIDVMGGKEKVASKQVVMCPADGAVKVARMFAVGEVPDPRPVGLKENLGTPITLSFYGGGEATAEVKEESGAVVECYVSTPKSPANPGRPDNSESVCILPKKALKAATKHTVTVTSGGKSWTWSFTTR